MTGEIITIVALFLVILFQGWQLYDQRKAFTAEKKDLFNRIMSANYSTYVQGEVLQKESNEKRNLTDAEIYELQQRGVPV